MHKFENQKGAVTAIFLAVVALVLTLILATTQSQLILSLRRSQSAADILIATYNAESEVNDIMAKLIAGYLDDADIPSYTKNVGDIKLEIEGQDMGEIQIVTVTATRGFAVGKVQATRRVASVENVNEVEIVIVLDCTTSMNSNSGAPGQSRFNALEEAAVKFVESVASQPDADKFKIGVAVFGTTSAWLQHNGASVLPGSLSLPELTDALQSGFGDTRQTSQCGNPNKGLGWVEDFTNVGLAFRHGNEYLKSSKKDGTKQIEIVITDGEPNSSTSDSQCGSTTCKGGCADVAKDYLRCTVADSATFVPEIGQNGVRDPGVDAYAVTIFDKPPEDVVTIFQNYASEDGYFNASRASQLTNILEGILKKIVENRSSITIKRVIPLPQ